MGLGGPVQDEGLLGDEFGDGGVLTVVDQLGVNFIRDYYQVGVLNRHCQFLDLLGGVGHPRRVGGVGQNQSLGTGVGGNGFFKLIRS